MVDIRWVSVAPFNNFRLVACGKGSLVVVYALDFMKVPPEEKCQGCVYVGLLLNVEIVN